MEPVRFTETEPYLNAEAAVFEEEDKKETDPNIEEAMDGTAGRTRRTAGSGRASREKQPWKTVSGSGKGLRLYAGKEPGSDSFF